MAGALIGFYLLFGGYFLHLGFARTTVMFIAAIVSAVCVFAILALDCSPAGLVRINAHFDKVLRTINAGDNPWKLSISLGTLHVDASHQLSIGDLLRKADGIMYERKRGRLVLA